MMTAESDDVDRRLRRMMTAFAAMSETAVRLVGLAVTLPNARIAAALGIAKGSVANYLAAATAAGLTHSEAQALDDAALNVRLHPQRCVHSQFAVPDFGEIPSRAATGQKQPVPRHNELTTP